MVNAKSLYFVGFYAKMPEIVGSNLLKSKPAKDASVITTRTCKNKKEVHDNNPEG